MKFNLDPCGYNTKPQKAEIGAIRNRLPNNKVDKTLQELAQAIENGQTFTPAEMDGRTAETWRSQQIIVADIDNDEPAKDENGEPIKDESGKAIKRAIENPLTPDEARAALGKHGISPALMYKTFSYSDALPKYRVVIVLSEAVTDPAQALDLMERFTNVFQTARPKCIDTTIVDLSRIIFGSTPGSIFYRNEHAVSLETLQAIPRPKYQEPERRTTAQAPERPTPEAHAGRTLEELKQRRKYDIDNFDMEKYIIGRFNPSITKSGKTKYYNPCPICGHKDDFTTNGNLWKCFGAFGDVGGNIIDFLEIHDRLTTPEAFMRFNEFMGYDSVEWSRAFKAEKKTEAQKKTPEMTTTAADPAPETPETGDAEQAEIEYITTNSASAQLQKFLADTENPADAIKTGFKEFDERTGGGLLPGLYIMGAISSLGKTTLALQIADNIARQGHDVLFFSLEMSRAELMARSISRITYEIGGEDIAKTNLQILRKRKTFNSQEAENFNLAISKYSEYAGKIFIFEGVENFGVKQICDTVEQHKRATGQTPIVFVDYLQILSPVDPHYTDKQNMDRSVLKLKRLSRDQETTVFCISAFNRETYKTGSESKGDANETSFRESSTIEYTADCLIALQFKSAGEDTYNAETERRRSVRQICCKLIKQRNARSGEKIYFEYDPRFSCFSETGAEDDRETAQPSKRHGKRERKAQELENAISIIKFEKLERGDNSAVTVEEIAEYLDVTRTTVERNIKEYGGGKYTITDAVGNIVFDGIVEEKSVDRIVNPFE